jgi:lipoate-protein ligase B
MEHSCRIRYLGRVEYGRAVAFQQKLVVKRAANNIPNTLLLLEHPPTYSVGLAGRRELLLANRNDLSRQKIAYYEADRSGSIFFHGPGQLAVYPILNLQDFGQNYHSYVEALESVIIRALHVFRVHAFRQPGQRGVWVLPRHEPYFASRWLETEEEVARIGLIGVKVNHHQVTSFGFYLNVATDLSCFDSIIPRGLPSCRVTSLKQILNKPIGIGEVIGPVIQSFCELFRFHPVPEELNWASIFNQAELSRQTSKIPTIKDQVL